MGLGKCISESKHGVILGSELLDFRGVFFLVVMKIMLFDQRLQQNACKDLLIPNSLKGLSGLPEHPKSSVLYGPCPVLPLTSITTLESII